MIVRTMSDLDPIAAEKACAAGFIHRCLASEAAISSTACDDQLTRTLFCGLVRLVLKHGPKSPTVVHIFTSAFACMLGHVHRRPIVR